MADNLITTPLDPNEWAANFRNTFPGTNPIGTVTIDGNDVTAVQTYTNPMEPIRSELLEQRPGMHWKAADPIITSGGERYTFEAEWALEPGTPNNYQVGQTFAIIAYWAADNEWDVLARVDLGNPESPYGDAYLGTGDLSTFETVTVGPSDEAPAGAEIRVIAATAPRGSAGENTVGDSILRNPVLTLEAGDDDEGDLDALVEELAPKVAAYVGRGNSSKAIETARGQLPIVIEFVRGYVRDNGFTDDVESGETVAERPLKAVIVAAASRLLVNPQQLRQYSTADYSASPATLQGYTTAEIGILHRYRRRSA